MNVVPRGRPVGGRVERGAGACRGVAIASAPDAVPPAEQRRRDAAGAIECSELTKRFGPVVALDGLTLSIPRGIAFGLLGPNGAGKTTLIRILLGLTSASHGSARLLDQEVPSRAARARVGYMPQELAIYPDLTVRENLALFGRLYGLSGVRLGRRITETLALVRMPEREGRLVATLSGGLRRRVSFAAALLAEPELLLLDEPTVGVDPELREEFWAYFHDLTRSGRTILLTTHYLEEASRCDEVAFLDAGRLLARGTPAALRESTGAATMEEAFLHLVRSRARRGGDP
jgi:ABC-type multidrug transport system ATPase subunit